MWERKKGLGVFCVSIMCNTGIPAIKYSAIICKYSDRTLKISQTLRWNCKLFSVRQVPVTCEHSQYKIDKKVKGYATYPSPDPYPTG
jgi:hypothetical protein